MIDHVTYEVPKNTLARDVIAKHLDDFFSYLDMEEVEADIKIEGEGWVVRWYEDGEGIQVHLVEGEGKIQRDLGLSHFCVVVAPELFARAKASRYLERDSGSGRIWLAGPLKLRVEVRSL